MMRPAILIIILIGAVLCGGCGSDGPSAAPTPIIANYAGNWTGTYTITGCTQSGGVALANICGSLGRALPFSMALTQSGANVSGAFTLGALVFPSTGGAVGPSGSLSLAATSMSGGVTIVAQWALNLPPSSSALTGTLVQTWTSTALSGQANVVGMMSTATR